MAFERKNLPEVDPSRIPGLLGEDVIRLSTLFKAGIDCRERGYFIHPQDPIDISASQDRYQGLATHVKIKKKTKIGKDGRGIPFSEEDSFNIDMAEAYPFWCLTGDHRLVILFYIEKTYVDLNGEKYTVMCVEEIVEIIITEETFKALRGEVTKEEIGIAKATLMNWKPNWKSLEQAKIEAKAMREKLKAIGASLRSRSGIAKPGYHFNFDSDDLKTTNKRLQSSVDTRPLITQVRSEIRPEGRGKYRNPDFPGSQVQDRVQIYRRGDNFHSIDLPWETRATTRRAAPGYEVKKVNGLKLAKTPVNTLTGAGAEDLQLWESVQTYTIPHGKITSLIHPDGMRTLFLNTTNQDVEENFRWVIKRIGVSRSNSGASYTITEDQESKVLSSFLPVPIPDGAQAPALKKHDKLRDTETFRTSLGPYKVQTFKSGDISFRQDSFRNQVLKEALERSMSLALHRANLNNPPRPILLPKKYKDEDEWLLKFWNADMKGSVIQAINDFSRLWS